MFGLDAYPLRVLIRRRRQNGWIPIWDRGRLQEVKSKAAKKVVIYRYLKLKKLKLKVPLPDTDFYQEIDGIPYIELCQLDRNTLYPVQLINDIIYLKKPIYELDKDKPIYEVKDGVVVTDEQGNENIIDYELKKDDEGEPIVKKYENIAIGGLDIMIDGGKILRVPRMHMTKTYDPKEVMAAEQERDSQLYNKPDKLHQLLVIGAYIIIAILIISMLYIAFKNLTPMFQQVISAAQSIQASNAQIADSLRIVSENLNGGSPVTSGTTTPF